MRLVWGWWVRIARLICLVAAFAGGGSAAWAEKVSPQDLAAIHSIGIFSELGDKAAIRRVGITVFGNRSDELDISDWQLNALVANEAVQALSGSFSVKTAPFEGSVLKDSKQTLSHWLFGPGESPFVALPDSGVDAYLAFLPSSEAFPYPSNQRVDGLGMVRYPGASSDAPGVVPGLLDGTPFAHQSPTAGIVYAIYEIFLVDAKTGRVLARQEGQIPTRYHETVAQYLIYGAPSAPIRYPNPHVYVDGVWAESSDALTDTQKQLFQDKLTALLKSSVGYSLEQMGLAAPAAPAPAQTAQVTATPSPVPSATTTPPPPVAEAPVAPPAAQNRP